VWKSFFHSVEKWGDIFPRNGKSFGDFSTQWKKFWRFFHTMEQLWTDFSTVWKKVFHAMEKGWAVRCRMGGG